MHIQASNLAALVSIHCETMDVYDEVLNMINNSNLYAVRKVSFVSEISSLLGPNLLPMDSPFQSCIKEEVCILCCASSNCLTYIHLL